MPQRKPLSERKVQPRGDFTRQRVLDAAIVEFASHGMDGASTRRIAFTAEVPQPLVGYHFGTKRELWRAALEAVMREMVEPIAQREIELQDLDAAKRLRLLLSDMFTWLTRKPHQYRLLLRAASDAGRDYCELAASLIRPHVLRIIALIEQAQATGQFVTGDPCLLYYMLLGCVANRSQLEKEHEIVCETDAVLTECGAQHIDASLALFFREPLPVSSRTTICKCQQGSEL